MFILLYGAVTLIFSSSLNLKKFNDDSIMEDLYALSSRTVRLAGLTCVCLPNLALSRYHFATGDYTVIFYDTVITFSALLVICTFIMYLFYF